ncbi:FecCD family ABC transporter permease [Pseudonocardia acaciae]|uniref:FecCD family ABC transporter permease n=1 Tax=Pseudonocardia acaciae TaxID=551276 RepID=UPI000ABF3ACB|nr:iron ABC transporter permease [Pseudonocardia acaciae]
MVGSAERVRSRPARGLGGTARRPGAAIAVAAVAALVIAVAALGLGRFGVPVEQVCRILAGQFVDLAPTWQPNQERVVLLVRLPRVLESLFVGGGLALAGAVLQAVFRNPLVSPQILGLSSGASVGGALALLLGLGSVAVVGGALAFGLASLVLLFALTRGGGAASPILMVVLAGVVIGSFASALVSLISYLADPQNQLPAIVFWLMGSLATATYPNALVAAVTLAVGAAVVLPLRWRVNVLSLGDEDAAALGVRPERLRWVLLVAVALVVAGAVAISGVIGWVGLVVPHLCRMWVGPDHRVLLPLSLLVGGGYLTVIDTIARTATPGEVPLGVLTAVVGAPAFFVLLRLRGRRVWADA